MPVVNAVPAVPVAEAEGSRIFSRAPEEGGAPVEETEEPAGELPGKKPEYNVVQPEVTREGKTIFKSVGALWKNVSKSGQEFYTLKIGKLRLLVFQNRERGQ